MSRFEEKIEEVIENKEPHEALIWAYQQGKQDKIKEIDWVTLEKEWLVLREFSEISVFEFLKRNIK